MAKKGVYVCQSCDAEVEVIKDSPMPEHCPELKCCGKEMVPKE